MIWQQAKRWFWGCVLVLSTAAQASDTLMQPGLTACWYFTQSSETQPEVEFARHDHCGYKNARGDWVMARAHLQALDFAPDHLATVQVAGQFYYVNRSGRTVPVVMYDNWADAFEAGLVRTQKQGKIGYVNTQLALVIPAIYDWGFPFEQGRAVVCRGCELIRHGDHQRVSGGQWGEINVQGEVVVPFVEKMR